jgi:hypothetical protein
MLAVSYYLGVLTAVGPHGSDLLLNTAMCLQGRLEVSFPKAAGDSYPAEVAYGFSKISASNLPGVRGSVSTKGMTGSRMVACCLQEHPQLGPKEAPDMPQPLFLP